MNKCGVLLLVASFFIAACESTSEQRNPRNNVDSCICTFEYRPVCGSDGKTYPNACALGCQQRKDSSLQMKHEGQCGSEVSRVTRAASCACTREYAPQCGSDGVTYNNPCLMRCAAAGGVRKVHSGQCGGRKGRAAQPLEVPSCSCTKERNPQCGTDGVTYANPCIFRCTGEVKGVQLKHAGSCSASDRKTREAPIEVPLCPCTKERNPQCGTDGVTYANPCLLRCAAKVKDIQLKHPGPCDGRKTRAAQSGPLCACPKNLRKVCGTNGVTYLNPCLLECSAKVDNTLSLLHEGPCEGSRNTREGQGPIEVPLCPCTKENNPQCGTDGVTYANPCLLRCAAKVKDIKLKHPGECGSR